ncbi:hypothetical protein DRN45_00145 [Thermococci archaeon]|nr:MAG: hypothetical protein DRN45_00145 [Thermococci archaeon]
MEKNTFISKKIIDQLRTEDIEIIVKENYIILKPKSLTEKVRGIVKGSKLSDEELEEIYLKMKG